MEETVKTSYKTEKSSIQALREKTSELRKTITDQLGHLTADTNQIIKVGAITLGVAVGAWLVIKLAQGVRTKKEVTYTPEGAVVTKTSSLPVVEMIKNAIATFLLSIARERIISFMEKMNQKHEESTGSSATSTKA